MKRLLLRAETNKKTIKLCKCIVQLWRISNRKIYEKFEPSEFEQVALTGSADRNYSYSIDNLYSNIIMKIYKISLKNIPICIAYIVTWAPTIWVGIWIYSYTFTLNEIYMLIYKCITQTTCRWVISTYTY